MLATIETKIFNKKHSSYENRQLLLFLTKKFSFYFSCFSYVFLSHPFVDTKMDIKQNKHNQEPYEFLSFLLLWFP
jgi:hypothetical protein